LNISLRIPHIPYRMTKYIIIAAGGSGTRVGGSILKQYIVLNHKPLIVHTLDSFVKYDPEVEFIIALPAGGITYWNENIADLVKTYSITLCEGGKERFHSVKNALSNIKKEGIVAVQDAVRPFASVALIARCFDAAHEYGSAIPVVPVNDTIRHIKADASVILDRGQLRAVQTPQCFMVSTLKSAYAQEYFPSFTDDASVLEAAGTPVHLVEGERTNIKITTADDLEYAEWLLERKK
jgi:2-C-methyl-D-erythritol 4-phosphate cytidylyltransferase